MPLHDAAHRAAVMLPCLPNTQVNENLVRVMGQLDPPEVFMQPQMLQRFLAYKAAELTPVPLKRMAAAALKPWWRGAAGAGVKRESESEAALRELMGWQG